jgi:hypothetical protein
MTTTLIEVKYLLGLCRTTVVPPNVLLCKRNKLDTCSIDHTLLAVGVIYNAWRVGVMVVGLIIR